MRILLILLVTFLTSNSFSQTLSGTITTEDGAPFEFVKIKILNPSDSSLIAGAYSDEKGEYSLNIGVGRYLIEASYTGFATSYQLRTIKSVNEKVRMDFELEVDKTLELEGVVAKGSLDVLKAGIDKKIYNASDDLSVKGGTVVDVLNNIPSIEVDQDGNISLRGDGNVVILIDGRPSAMAMGDGQNLLDALPANSIERIEVVTNPSAKYDPDGTSGIINIVLKKNKLKGFNGMISLTAATGNQYEANAAFSYRNKSFNAYFNYSFNYYEGYRNFESQLFRDVTSDSTILFEQKREGTDTKMGNTLVFGADYKINDLNTIGLVLTGSLGDRQRTGDLKNKLYGGSGNLEDEWRRISLDPRSNRNLDANLNYTKKFKEQRGELSFNINQTFGDKHIEGFYDEIYLLDGGANSAKGNLSQRLLNDEQSKVSTGQVDFSYIFPKIKSRIEFGAKSILMNDQILTYSETKDSITSLFEEDTLSNFQYAFDQHVHSVYGIFGQELGKFKYQVGVRGEYALQAPNLISSGESFSKTYMNLFPSGHVRYGISKKSEVSLSYSRRINRPRSRQLNPFTSYADPFNRRSGNPYLDPEYIDSYDLGYSFTSKKFIFSTSVFHRRTKDVINRVKIYYPDNTAIVIYDNIDNSNSTGAEAVFIIKPFPWFKNTLSGNANYIEYVNNDPSTDWNNSGVSWGVKYVGNVDFWHKSASLQLNLRYVAPRVSPQGIVRRRTGVDLSVEKRFLDKKLSVLLKVTDIFNQVGFELDLDQEGVRQISEYKWLTRRFFVTVTYKFGKLDKKMRSPRSSSGGMD